MLLIYLFLITATTSAANHPHKRNSRKFVVNNEYSTSVANKPLDENQHRSSRKYIPVHRALKHKEPESISRSDRFTAPETDDLTKNYNRTRRHNFRKYVTTDEIRPPRMQHSVSRNIRRSNNKHSMARQNYFDEIEEDIKPSQNWYVQQKQGLSGKMRKNYEFEQDFIPHSNYHVESTTSRAREEDKYSSFDINHYLKNPFLVSVLKESPSTGFLPPIEATPSSVEFLPPIQPIDFFSPSPEIVNPNYQPVLIPPNFDHQPSYEYVNPAKVTENYSQEINMKQITEPITVQPNIFHFGIQNLPPSTVEPVTIQHILEKNHSPNIFLPPNFSKDDHLNEYSDRDSSNMLDPYEREEIRKMRFESVKIRNESPSTQNPIKHNFYSNPMVMISPATIREPYNVEPIITEVKRIENNNSNYLDPSQRRYDLSPLYQVNSNTNNEYNQFEVMQRHVTQPPSRYSQNSIDRSSQDRSQYLMEIRNSEQTPHIQIEENTRPIEYTSPLDNKAYGSKIGQHQYLFASERSNDQQMPIYDESLTSDILIHAEKPTTTIHEDININNARKQAQEFDRPVSKTVHKQEYNDYQQDNGNFNQDIYITPKQNEGFINLPTNAKVSQEFSSTTTSKPSQAYYSTTTILYPKEFTKALKVYVDKQKSRPKEEKPIEKKLRQPKEYPRQYSKELLQRSETGSIFSQNEPIVAHYEEQFIDPQHDAYLQTYNYTYNRGPTTEQVPVLRETKEMAIDGSFHYETLIGDQTHVIQEGHIENPGTEDEEQVIHGSYSFLGDDGKTYTVNYVADSNGFRASGDHLPTPPPIPEIIQRSIEKNLAEAEKNAVLESNNYKIDPNSNDVNGFRERSSTGKGYFPSYNKHKNDEQRTQNIKNIEPFKHNTQPNLQQTIQPRADKTYFTELYPIYRTKNDDARSKNFEHSHYSPFMEKRSDQGFEIQDKDTFENDEIEMSMNYRNVQNQNENFGEVNTRNDNQHENNLQENKKSQKTNLVIQVDPNDQDYINSYDKTDYSNVRIPYSVQPSMAHDVYTSNKMLNLSDNDFNPSTNTNHNTQNNYKNNENNAVQNESLNEQEHLINNQNIEIKRISR